MYSRILYEQLVDQAGRRLAEGLPLLIQSNIDYRIYIERIIYTAGREVYGWEC